MLFKNYRNSQNLQISISGHIMNSLAQLELIQQKKSAVLEQLKRDIYQMEQNLAIDPFIKNVRHRPKPISKSVMIPDFYNNTVNDKKIQNNIKINNPPIKGKSSEKNIYMETKKSQKIDIQYQRTNELLDQDMDQTLLKYKKLMLTRQKILNNIHKASEPFQSIINSENRTQYKQKSHQQEYIQQLLKQKQLLVEQLNYARNFIQQIQTEKSTDEKILFLMKQNQNLLKKVHIYERELFEIRARVEEIDHYAKEEEEKNKEKQMKNVPTFTNLQIVDNNTQNNKEFLQKIQLTLDNIFRVYHSQHDEVWEGLLTKALRPNPTLSKNIKADIEHLYNVIKKQILKLIKEEQLDKNKHIPEETNHLQINFLTEKIKGYQRVIEKLTHQLSKYNKSKIFKNNEEDTERKIIQLKEDNLAIIREYQERINKLVIQLQRTAINKKQLQHYKEKCKELQTENLSLEKKYLELRMSPLYRQQQPIKNEYQKIGRHKAGTSY